MTFFKIIIPILFVVFINYIPFYKVQTGEWQTLPFLLFFWLETAIVIFFSALKMYKIAKDGNIGTKYEGYDIKVNGKHIDPYTLTPLRNVIPPTIGMALFSIVHFMLIFPISALTFDSGVTDKAALIFDQIQIFLGSLMWVFPALLVSSYVNYKFIFIDKKEYLFSSMASHMTRPFLRIFFLQAALIVGAILADLLNSPLMIVGILLGFKTLVEILQSIVPSRVAQTRI